MHSFILGRERYIYPAFALALLVFAYQSYAWMGVAFLVSGAVMWALLHYSRMLQVFKKAANRPIGYVGSAVMLNAKLRTGLSLLHVIALTKSLGELQATKADGEVETASGNVSLTKGEKKAVVTEIFVWRDGSESSVRCTFHNGKLSAFELIRPVQEERSSD